ncbi:hypothetical protein DQ384_38315 [Sphaerisporangium album]|uniref:Uncharacterized protein n=1 Tax=Sphaerisporangium album TaxID=509200 RepID=A0A367ELY4_9ACTN|nr:hypothetical protein DQ384_38315 [Sphaerisporangium album]
MARLLLPLLRDFGVLVVGDQTEVPNRRDGGLRIVFELVPADEGGPQRVQAERVDGGVRRLADGPSAGRRAACGLPASDPRVPLTTRPCRPSQGRDHTPGRPAVAPSQRRRGHHASLAPYNSEHDLQEVYLDR